MSKKSTNLGKFAADQSLKLQGEDGLEKAAEKMAGDAKYKQIFILHPRRLLEKRKYKKQIKKNQEKLVQEMSSEALVEAFLRRALDHRGDSNIAWQTFGLRLTGLVKHDFGALILPAFFTLEVSGNVSVAACKQLLLLVRAQQTPKQRGRLRQIWAEERVKESIGFDLSLDNHLLLAAMEGSRFEFKAGFAVETGLKVPKVLDSITTAAAGFSIECKATATANAKGEFEGYRVCDYAPQFFANRAAMRDAYAIILKGQSESKKELKQKIEHFFEGGLIKHKKHQPFNSLCSVTYFQKKAAGGLSVQAEAEVTKSLSSKKATAKGLGKMDVKLAVGASAGIEGSYSVAGFRIQSADEHDFGEPCLMQTQDTTVLYKRVQANWGLNVGSKVNTKIGDREKSHFEDKLQKEKAWVDSVSYKSCVTFWLLEYQDGIDTYDKDFDKGKRIPLYNALFPRSVLPGSGIQLGESLPAGLLFSIWKHKHELLSEHPDEVPGIKKMRAVLVHLARALKISTRTLTNFLLELDFYLDSIDWENTGNDFKVPHTTAFLIEANFEAPAARDLPNGNFKRADTEKTTWNYHHLGECSKQRKSKGRFKGIRDLTTFYTMQLDDEATTSHYGKYAHIFGGDVKVESMKLWEKNLQTLRLRYRSGDQRDNTKTLYKLGFKVGSVVDASLTLDKIDRVGFEGIVDLAAEWYGITPEDTAEGQEWRVPPCTLLY